jgi:hypothetical protein
MIEEIIDHIGKLNDKVDSDKWAVAEAVHDAFQEFPHHTQGLLQGLANRLKVSNTQVYSYRNAWRLVERIGKIGSSPSHYARIELLGEKFGLSDSEIEEYLNLAWEECWSVEKMAMVIQDNHDPAPELKEQKTFEKMVKTMRLVWTYPIMGEVSDHTRMYFYKALKELEDFINGRQ